MSRYNSNYFTDEGENDLAYNTTVNLELIGYLSGDYSEDFSNPDSNVSGNGSVTLQINDDERKQKNKLAARKARAKKAHDKSKVDLSFKELSDKNEKLTQKVNKITSVTNYCKSLIKQLNRSSDSSPTQLNDVVLQPSVYPETPAVSYNVPTFLVTVENNQTNEKISTAVQCDDQNANGNFLPKFPDQFESSLPLERLTSLDLELLSNDIHDCEDIEMDDSFSRFDHCSQTIVHETAPVEIQFIDHDAPNQTRSFPCTFTAEQRMLASPIRYYEIDPLKTWFNQVQSVSSDPLPTGQFQTNFSTDISVADSIDLSFLNEWDPVTRETLLNLNSFAY